MRALLVTGLLVSGAAAAADYEATATEITTPRRVAPKAPSTATSARRRAPVARWDGKVVEAGKTVRGLRDDAREAIETWRRFAVNRGYRIDLDETQRVVVLSDFERFEHYHASATVVERTLEALEPFCSPSEHPLVVLRASDEEHLATATTAAEALGFGARLVAYVEDGSRSDRRAVDARLAESLVRLQLTLEQPFLSEWMADGLASVIAEATTERALVDGEVRTLRSVQSEVARATGGRDSWRVSLYEVSGVRVQGEAKPSQPDAMAIVAFLDRYHAEALAKIVAECGRNAPMEGRSKYREEERALERQLGKTWQDELSEALREGRAYRP